MKNLFTKKIINYILPVLLFVFISYAYFPGLIQGKKLLPNDTRVSMGSSREINEHREKYGEEPLWTNSMFSGMPSYTISTKYPSNLSRFIPKIVEIGSRPASYLIMYFVSVYILLIAFGVGPWLAFIGAFAVSFTTNNFILMGAGHMTKVHTLAFVGGAVAGVILAFRGKALWGGALTGLFVSLMFWANHLQITFYTFLMMLIIGIVYFIFAIKEKTLVDFFKQVGVLVVALILAVGSNWSTLATTYEYSKYSTRSKTELTKNVENKTGGLDRDYITAWSYGRAETLSLMIPDFRNGGSADPKPNSAFYKKVQPILKSQILKNGSSVSEASKSADRQIGSMFYWGGKPITDGPSYHGAIICFLFVLSLFLLKGRDKWWLLSATILAILLSWGKYFPFLTNLFIDYFPFYDKFRDTTTLMSIAQFTMPVLALLGLNVIFKGEYDRQKFMNALLWSLGLTGGVSLLFVLVPSFAGSYSGAHDAQLPQSFVDLLVESRKAALRSDALRSLLLIGISGGGIYYFVKGKLSHKYLVAMLIVLVAFDFITVNHRYLNNSDLVRPVKSAYVASPADKMILKDTTPDYRVLNLGVSPFNDASTSNFHLSIGGYHGAKMRRYQELIENKLHADINYLATNLQKEQLEVFKHTSILNMLNTRYVIVNPNSAPVYNKYAMGHAWFVSTVKMVGTVDEELEAMKSLNPSTEAVVNDKYKDLLDGLNVKNDPQSSIEQLEYRANYLKYQSVSQTDQLAVFSEIYYPKGWNVYLDGEKVDHLNADYVLRALPIPAGKHNIEFKFEPQSYIIGNKVSFASSLLLILMLLGAIYKELIKKN